MCYNTAWCQRRSSASGAIVMLVNWTGVRIVCAALAVVLGLCALDVCCSGKPTENSTLTHVKDEIAAGEREYRQMKADDLARVALDMRVMAKRYAKKGESKKAQQAIAAALELDAEIKRLRSEK